jgi:uncharacterized protein
MIRVVLDANVLVSGILSSNGAPARILDAWRERRLQLCVSTPILDEVARVLRYPKIAKRHGWTEEETDVFVSTLASLSVPTMPEISLEVIVRDPTDNRYLECAVAARARYVVSGDRDLLDLQTYEEIAIVTPRVFLDRLDAR